MTSVATKKQAAQDRASQKTPVRPQFRLVKSTGQLEGPQWKAVIGEPETLAGLAAKYKQVPLSPAPQLDVVPSVDEKPKTLADVVTKYVNEEPRTLADIVAKYAEQEDPNTKLWDLGVDGHMTFAEVVEKYDKLISKWAGKKEDDAKWVAMDVPDLMQEVYLFLLTEKLEEFDPKLGNRFITPLKWWARRALTKELRDKYEKNGAVYNHVGLIGVFREALGIYEGVPDKTARTKTSRKLFEKMVSGERGEESVRAEFERMRSVLSQLRGHKLLSAPKFRFKDGKKVRTYGETTAEPGYNIREAVQNRAVEDIDSIERKKAVWSALHGLTRRQRILIMRLYFDEDWKSDDKPPTIAGVGRGMGITKQAAHQLHNHAIQRLRKALAGSEYVQDFFEKGAAELAPAEAPTQARSSV